MSRSAQVCQVQLARRLFGERRLLRDMSEGELRASMPAVPTLAQLVAETVGFDGDISWDEARPDGTPRKLMDSRRMRALGWEPTVDLRSGLRAFYSQLLDEKVFVTS